MFRKPIAVALIALVALTGTLVAPKHASASSQYTAAVRKAAERATQAAAVATQRAAAIQNSYDGELALFNAAVASGNKMKIHYGKSRFINYLNRVQSALRAAIFAHKTAIRHWENYNRVTNSSNANGTIRALTRAIGDFQRTVNQAQVHKNMAGNAR